MGHIDTEYVETLLDDKRPKVFVETGTFKGGIPQRMLMDGTFDKWNKVYTIELNRELYKKNRDIEKVTIFIFQQRQRSRLHLSS